MSVLLVTVTKVESKAVLNVFEQATGKKAQPKPIGDRTYFGLGIVNGTRVNLVLSEMGSGGLGGSIQTLQKGIEALSPQSEDVAACLNDLAEVEQQSGDYVAAERDYSEALRIARKTNNGDGVASCLSNLAQLAVARKDWSSAEQLALDALHLAEGIGRLDLIGSNCCMLALTLACQGRHADGLPHARRAGRGFHQAAEVRRPRTCAVRVARM